MLSNKEGIMKKIYKIVPALFAVGILTACDSFKIDVKEPTFASKGKSIDQETFRTEIIKSYYENEFFKEGMDLNSKVLQYKETIIEKQNRAKNKKVYFTDEKTVLSEGVMKYDSKNLLLEHETNNKELREVESDEENIKKTLKGNEKSFMQVGADDYANKIVNFDRNRMQIDIVKTLTSESEAKETFDNTIASIFTNYFNSSRVMHFAEASEVSLYKFYKNSNMFTVTYKESYETSEQSTINEHSVDVKKYYVKRETKSQVDLTENAEAVRIIDTAVTTCEILQDHDGYKKGEIIDVQNTRYVVCSVGHKNIELDRITNYSAYRLNN